jgi:uncharacterized protein YggE
MKTFAIALSSFLALAAPALAQTAAQRGPHVVVTGEGAVEATPDQAWVSIGVESRSKQSKDAQSRNAQVMTAIQQKITALGVPKDAIRTTAIDLQLEFDYADGKQAPRGYVARNTVEVRVDELGRLGDVLDAVVGSGATMIHGLRFDVKERERLETTALQSAVKSAMVKAQALAAGSGKTIDHIMSIEEIGGHTPPPMPRPYAMAARAESSTPVAPGELEIRAAVRLTAAIK